MTPPTPAQNGGLKAARPTPFCYGGAPCVFCFMNEFWVIPVVRERIALPLTQIYGDKYTVLRAYLIVISFVVVNINA